MTPLNPTPIWDAPGEGVGVARAEIGKTGPHHGWTTLTTRIRNRLGWSGMRSR